MKVIEHEGLTRLELKCNFGAGGVQRWWSSEAHYITELVCQVAMAFWIPIKGQYVLWYSKNVLELIALVSSRVCGDLH